MTVLLTVPAPVDAPGRIPVVPVARALAAGLLVKGQAVRVLSRVRNEVWPEGVELVDGDVAQPEGAAPAFEGISALLLAGASPATVHRALELAAAGGAGRVVVLSSHGPDVEVAFPPEYWEWLAVEVVAERCGLPWCHVVPSLPFATAISASYPMALPSLRDSVQAGGPVMRPFAMARLPSIDERDLADVLRLALFDRDFVGKRIHATGYGLSEADRVEAVIRATGQAVELRDLSRDDGLLYLTSQGLEDDEAAYVLDTTGWFLEHVDAHEGEAARLLGRSLRSFDAWARENCDAFRTA
ncbi:uncharacterized protein YbjT (DUF2867 family) [Microbacterium sp. AK009]|uniref:NAD(P)H-binding protein n=1 Tax=Microbacterium sp. AK009 TaxID=2723068 RepID=UPI0015CDB0CF|nr:NAD(P)H-binding protein [Microbacterium sp. AK009]NYF18034.1 uncharacterized protein YbjT (DUF2867 family) [Microbacterium sp. AK009]